jgi:hypothetical protein
MLPRPLAVCSSRAHGHSAAAGCLPAQPTAGSFPARCQAHWQPSEITLFDHGLLLRIALVGLIGWLGWIAWTSPTASPCCASRPGPGQPDWIVRNLRSVGKWSPSLLVIDLKCGSSHGVRNKHATSRLYSINGYDKPFLFFSLAC